MNNEVIITCAITGAGDTVGKHPAIPVTPQQIADAAIEAANAGAANDAAIARLNQIPRIAPLRPRETAEADLPSHCYSTHLKLSVNPA